MAVSAYFHSPQQNQNPAYTTYNQYGMMSYYSPNLPQQFTTQSQYSQYQQYTSPVTMDQAKSLAMQYLQSTGNPDLALKEIMEFQYNFYITFYEKSTGRGAFEMVIWKEIPADGMMGGGMMGGWTGGNIQVGYMMPEPGPNMMWNTKYSPMASGMMGFKYGNNYNYQSASAMTVSEDQAMQYAQTYLDSHFSNAKTEMATEFYGYYTFDFTVNGQVTGMLSVNGNTGQVWYHSWHGAYVQEVEFT